MKNNYKFKSLLPTYHNKQGCCPPIDYTKKFYHPHCCPGKKKQSGTCSNHDYPGHFSSVISYPIISDKCNPSLPYEYYHYKRKVHSKQPWNVYRVMTISNKIKCNCKK